MKRIFTGLTLVCLTHLLSSCQQESDNTKTMSKIKARDAGKHALLGSDPRQLPSYPVLVIVAAKRKVGIDTVAQIIRAFNKRFDALAYTTIVEFPVYMGRRFEEDAHPIAEDAVFLSQQGKPFNLSGTEVADILSDYFILVGSNRELPSEANH